MDAVDAGRQTEVDHQSSDVAVAVADTAAEVSHNSRPARRDTGAAGTGPSTAGQLRTPAPRVTS